VPMMRHLLEVLDRSERPVLIHCHKGADRTGMASALALLLFTDADVSEARWQLAPPNGHLRLGRPANMDRFFDLYEEWLAAQGQRHSPDALRRWVRHDYCAGEGSAVIEVVAPAGRPLRLPRSQPVLVRVRCHNTSVKTWHFQPGTNAGIHVRYVVLDEQQRGVGSEERAGLFEALVPPGQHLDVMLPLPPLHQAGPYLLRVDLADEQHGSFLQLGSEPLFWELEVL
jgi:Tyrosine phosphatase family